MKLLKNSKGYTLMELVAALMVTTAVFGILYGVYRYTNSLYNDNLKYNSFTYDAIQLAKSIEKNLLNAKKITEISNNSIRFQKQNGIYGNITFEDDRVTYNSRPMHSTSVVVSHFDIGVLQSSCNMSWNDITSVSSCDLNNDGVLTLEEITKLSFLKISIIVKNKSDTVRYVISNSLQK
ncbi:MAG: hypothetical protein JNL74_10840 [Fibrobacteres bacterium]|nr:hypothetical protein [Fibrobacterota bacterium]